MKAKEALCLLTAKVQRYVASNGGVPEITQEDMSHAMGYIKERKHALLIGVKYCGRSEDIRELDYELWLSVVFSYPEWRDEGYTKGKEFIRHLCQMALAEHVDEHRCPTCKGTSQKLKEDLKNAFNKDFVFCDTCKDTGRVYPSEELRAKVVGINEKLWDRHWSEKYRKIQSLLSDWETSAANDLCNAMEDYQ